ncbi:spore maturation protein [Sporolactobacillus terrae]|uniref:Spore maturation protein n=1 Tax=Sporolactobacillus terrae TaxID=269673 RepID=A0A410D985_9BACL|nr:spore maturation protein [Sporolactobacillus terrae]QAA22644.1 spore maturation protein [Sporolactobacillus terrae]QAA25618.1 spore maturation protein [Sporolactobacillus terrae]UAK17427.1 spore maturation protein [Sporolactobacillus terrae]BBN98971.1 spore maturation protein B [Sporolactobacillus terrae]
MSLITTFSTWLVPCLIAVVLLYGTLKKVPSYDAFVEGGKEGFSLAISVMPFLVGMLVAISVFRASGAMDALIHFIRPLMSAIGMPSQVLPLALMRPLSGTGALGLMTDLVKTYGPDSFVGRLASVMQGSTDTTFYVVTVYFGAVGIHRIGDALKVGLLADLVGVISAVCIVTWAFG